MSKSLGFQQMTRLTAHENIIDNQHRKMFKSYTFPINYILLDNICFHFKMYFPCRSFNSFVRRVLVMAPTTGQASYYEEFPAEIVCMQIKYLQENTF